MPNDVGRRREEIVGLVTKKRRGATKHLCCPGDVISVNFEQRSVCADLGTPKVNLRVLRWFFSVSILLDGIGLMVRFCMRWCCRAGRLFTVTAFGLALLLGEGVAQDSPAASSDAESSPAALAIFAEAAGFQNSKQFDLAADEWRRFLKDHASDPRAFEARYNLAVCLIQEEKFSSAIEQLTQVVEKASGDFERMPDALLNLGWSQYSLAQANQPKLFAAAAKTFEKLLTKYPQAEFRDQALFFGGESLYLQGKLKGAIQYYQELVDKHGDSDMHSEALYALGVTLEDTKDFATAGKVYDRFLEKYRAHDLATEVRMRKAETVLQAGDFPAAAKLFGEVAQIDGFRGEDHARYRQAFCIAQAGDFAEAAAIFGRIANELPNSAYAADAAIAAGRAYYRASAFPEASEWFQRVMSSESPHRPEAAHWQARILLDQQKQPEQARELVQQVLPQAQQHPFYVSLKLDRADALYEIEASRQAAVTAYLQLAQDHPEHQLAPKALYNAAYGAMELGRYQQGLDIANQFSTKFAKHALTPEVQKVVAECKLQLGDAVAAAKEFKKLAEAGKEDGTKFELRRGLSLFLSKKYDEAIAVLEQVFLTSVSNDEKAEAAFWLGRSYAGKKQLERAVSAFEMSQAANPEWKQADEVLLNLAHTLRRLDKFDDAKKTLEKLLAAYPQSQILDQAHYRMAELAYATEDYPRAVEQYSKVLATWPDSKLVPFSLYGRGWSRLRSGSADQSLKDFDELIRRYSQHELAEQTLYARGMALHQIGDHRTALQTVEAYLATTPKPSARSDARYLKGLSHVGLKAFDQAIATFEELLSDDEDYVNRDKVLYELAWAHKNRSAATEAIDVFKRLVNETPQSPLAAEAHYHLGEQHYTSKEYQQALPRYESAVRLAKTKDLLEKAAYKLGWTNYQLQQFDKALEAFDKQLAANQPSHLAADAEFMRAECLFKQGNHQQALVAYRRAKQQPPKTETMQVLTYLHAGQAAAQLQQWQASLEWVAELKQRFPKSPYLPQATYEQGWAQRNLGQLDDALKSFQQVTARSRNELGARARFMAGEVLFEKKDYEAAILEFRRVMFGYGGEKAGEGIKQWQAKAAFEAGRCASVLAGNATNAERRAELIEDARGFFSYVAEKHAKADEAEEAKKQLQRLQPAARRIGNRPREAGV